MLKRSKISVSSLSSTSSSSSFNAEWETGASPRGALHEEQPFCFSPISSTTRKRLRRELGMSQPEEELMNQNIGPLPLTSSALTPAKRKSLRESFDLKTGVYKRQVLEIVKNDFLTGNCFESSLTVLEEEELCDESPCKVLRRS
eukprot:CAMPEP_0172464270 /NCGR_PEP_ID=MMETSP1065-20121228/49946_1 /TAXON_ID=265537 /ORGANISM="Amphiprora paludosa, Strain CCMP125" /LENGTH=143 /DNA_ID=CAMNT_0013220453 /DNA_START=136 /DNA_END=567 /DNA_ORIENTATION=+